jgi:hypothetical protein
MGIRLAFISSSGPINTLGIKLSTRPGTAKTKTGRINNLYFLLTRNIFNEIHNMKDNKNFQSKSFLERLAT